MKLPLAVTRCGRLSSILWQVHVGQIGELKGLQQQLIGMRSLFALFGEILTHHEKSGLLLRRRR